MEASELFVNQLYYPNKPGCEQTANTLSAVRPDPPPWVDVSEFTRAPTVQGDHVTANDYWSSVSECTNGVGDTARGSFIWTYRANPDNSVPPASCIAAPINCGRVSFGFDPRGHVPAPDARWKLPEVSAADLDFCQRLADTKALANLNRSLVNLPMLFKERKETLRMMGEKVSGMAKVARDIQDRDAATWRKLKSRASKRNAAREISNRHLETIFGWLPLIGEIEGALEFAQMPSLDFVRARGTYNLPLGDSDVHTRSEVLLPYGISSLNGNLPERLGAVVSKGFEMRTLSVRTALRYDLEIGIAADARLLGFEPIATFYDMVPLSFVSGWFSNFDAYVRTIAPLIGLQFKTGSRNRRVRALWEASASFEPVMPLETSDLRKAWETVPELFGSVIARKEDNIRVKLTQPPEASLLWNVDVGLFEVAAGVSLAVQRYLKPLQRLIKQKPFRYRGPRPRNLPSIRYRRP